LCQGLIRNKTFYYYSDSKCFILGSQINQTIASKECTLALNEAIVCEYLNNSYADGTSGRQGFNDPDGGSKPGRG